jgi:predicted ArsR family transcriptional regulator
MNTVEILAFLAEPRSPSEVAQVLGIRSKGVRHRLARLIESGHVGWTATAAGKRRYHSTGKPHEDMETWQERTARLGRHQVVKKTRMHGGQGYRVNRITLPGMPV